MVTLKKMKKIYVSQIKTFDGTRHDVEKKLNEWLQEHPKTDVTDVQIRPQYGWGFISFIGWGSHDKHIGYVVYFTHIEV